MSGQRPGPSIWMRPERAAVGRPAQRSRAEITAAAVSVADREGLDAVSMRRVAAELGTGAASLYRYVETREELLDLMTDAMGGEYSLPPPSEDWLADLVTIGEQSLAIMRRHPWLVTLAITRPVLGPNGVAVLEHYLAVLAAHPAGVTAKLEAFGMLNGITALFAQHEVAGGSSLQRRNVAYLLHAASSGEHPRLGQLLPVAAASAEPARAPDPADSYRDIITRILTGLLGPPPSTPDGQVPPAAEPA
jgi:AcrR family transcriptional regulator